MSELRECPFCGGKAFLERWMPDNDGRVYCQSCVASQPVTTQQSDTSAIAAWNRRAPSAEEMRLRAEVASLRAALGQQPAAEGAEPVGCPIPGMCAGVAAHAASYRAGAEDMREAAAREVACGCPNSDAVLAAETKADRWRACAHDPCGAIEAAAIRALPLPAGGSGWQPIETAPKDGTSILCYAPGTHDREAVRRTDYWWIEQRAFAHMRPSQPYTHWQPLPTVPEDTP